MDLPIFGVSDSLPDHFYLAPSSADRWIRCPGSLRACADIPDEAGEAAERGTLGHTLVEVDLVGEPVPDDAQEFLNSLDGDTRERLLRHVQICVDHVSESDADVILYETKIQSNFLEEHGGTIDVTEYWEGTQTLRVTDFKFGKVWVDHEDNKQIQCYINLARQLFPEAEKFEGRIIQPVFNPTVRSSTYTLEQLQQHEADVLEASISDHFKAGDHCFYCPFGESGQCETLAKHLKDQVQNDFPTLTDLVGGISNRPPTEDEIEKLCKIYKTFKLAEKATEGAGNILKRWAREGSNLSAHGLGVRVTHVTDWKDGAEEVLEEIYGDIEGFKTTKLATPAQFRDAIGMKKAAFEEEYERAINKIERRSLIMGKDQNEFPEFD